MNHWYALEIVGDALRRRCMTRSQAWQYRWTESSPTWGQRWVWTGCCSRKRTLLNGATCRAMWDVNYLFRCFYFLPMHGNGERSAVLYHPGAGFLGVDFAPLDVQLFEPAWPIAHSYYLLSRTKPTMLQSLRIAQAGQSPLHGALAAALEANAVVIDVETWAAAVGAGAR